MNSFFVLLGEQQYPFSKIRIQYKSLVFYGLQNSFILSSQENRRCIIVPTLQMRNVSSDRGSDFSKVPWLLSESNRAWPQVS